MRERPNEGFYFHRSTREVFWNADRAGWIVPCSNIGQDFMGGGIMSWRFIPDDDIYEEQSATSLGALIEHMKKQIRFTNEQINSA